MMIDWRWLFRLILAGVFIFCLPRRGLSQTDSAKLLRIDTLKSAALNPVAFPRPQKFAFITQVPSDMWQMANAPFRKENLKGMAFTAAASALLIWQDQRIMDKALGFGKALRLNPETDFGVVWQAFGTKVIKYPRNLNTALYQMGEGGTSMLLAFGLFIHGKIEQNNRSLQTARDLAETFITMGISTQLLKRSFGRQSPFVSSQPGGDWHFFPAFSDYQAHTPNYDGFPSGHLATMMATVTVLSLNYPEKKWIKPIGYSIMGLSAFAMMNTEVHWAGDYPLALALGYLSAKITVGRHQPRKRTILSGSLH